jgi:hypothetical protein
MTYVVFYDILAKLININEYVKYISKKKSQNFTFFLKYKGQKAQYFTSNKKWIRT